MKRHLALGFRLAFTVAVVVAMLSAVNVLTRNRIAERQSAAGQAARSALMEGTFTQVSDFGIPEEYGTVTAVYQGEKDGVVIGYCFDVTVKGYNEISMIVGIGVDLTVTGVKILSQTETPGIGSKAVDENGTYLPQFKGVSYRNLDSVTAVSGATLSSEGIRKGVSDGIAVCRLLLEGKGE